MPALVVGLALAPVRALAAPGDQAATRAYLRADYRLVQAASSKIPGGEATLRELLAQVRRECPSVAAGHPQNAQGTELEYEVIGAMVTALVALDRSAGHAFVSATRRLKWSNRKLTRAAHRYVGQVGTLLVLPQPNICSDVESWANSGFSTLSAATVTFTPRFLNAWVAVGHLPAGLVRSETPDERPLSTRTRQLEEELADLEAREVATYGHIISTLGL